ncbi:hypothetical protein V6N11_051870 [Hibiscus sabdariffa]|uniref:Uncharacterized protein n=1 Tax=Hibiscus sabdariffa TaxID=183260 RepID=A0ABR2U942_9ROSI
MANACGFLTSSFSSLRIKVQPFESEGLLRTRAVVVCSSGIEDVGKHVSPSPVDQSLKLVSNGCKLVGCGSAVPSLSISNYDLGKIVDTSDEWISARTGIRNRRVLSGNESLRSLAAEAARKALEMADVDADDLDLILMCTSTPDNLFGDAPQVQRDLGCTKTPIACDIRAACSGFMLGLFSAACYVKGGGLHKILVIGADAVSRFTDWTDRGTCVLFGDAAGAVVVQACNAEEDGLLSFDLHSDGEGGRHLGSTIKYTQTNDLSGSNGSVFEFPSRKSSYPFVQMNGQEVFRFAARRVPQSIETALKKASLTASGIDWLLLHQANQRIIDAVATRLEFPPEKVISNLANYGNTSAASIPLALDEAVRSGKVKQGHTIAAAGFGAGLTWASAIIRWG